MRRVKFNWEQSFHPHITLLIYLLGTDNFYNLIKGTEHHYTINIKNLHASIFYAICKYRIIFLKKNYLKVLSPNNAELLWHGI